MGNERSRRFRFSLRAKVVVAVLAMALFFDAVIASGSAFVLTAFANTESTAARKDMSRAVGLIRVNIDRLKKAVNGFAESDDTVFAIEDLNRANGSVFSAPVFYKWLVNSFRSYTSGDSVDILLVKGLAVYGPGGKFLASLYLGSSGSAELDAFFRSDALRALLPETVGIVALPGDSFIVAAMPAAYNSKEMLENDTTGAGSHGSLLFVGPTSSRMQEFSNGLPACVAQWLNSTSFKPRGLKKSKLPETDELWQGSTVLETVSRGEAESTRKTADLYACPENTKTGSYSDVAAVYAMLEDYAGLPSPLLRVENPRAAYHQGKNLVVTVLVVIFVLNAFIAIGFCIWLDVTVLQRITAISKLMAKSAPALPKREIFRDICSDPTEIASFEEADSGDEIAMLEHHMKHNFGVIEERYKHVSLLLFTRREANLALQRALTIFNVCCGRLDEQPLLHANHITPDQGPPSFAQIAGNPLGLQCLLAFAIQEASVENIRFLIDLHFLKLLNFTDKEKALSVVQGIIQNYIGETAKEQVNVSAQSAQKIIDTSNEEDISIFDDAEREITHLVTTDILRRFFTSSSFSLMRLLDSVQEAQAGDRPLWLKLLCSGVEAYQTTSNVSRKTQHK